MRRIVRKSCAALAAACLVCTMLPAAALAEVTTLADEPVSGTVEVDENWTLAYTVEDGEATIDYAAVYPEGTADLELPDTVPDPGANGTTVPVTGIGQGAFCGDANNDDYHEGGNHLGRVDLPDSVRYIERRAFYTTSMTSISIGTGIAYVKQYGLAHNEAMKTVVFEDGAHPEYFANYAFCNNTSLLEFSVPALTGTEFTSDWTYRIGNSCFADCSLLETVTFEAGDPNKGSEYTLGDPSRPAGWFSGCNLQTVISFLENLELNIDAYAGNYGAPSESTYIMYDALYFYSSEAEVEADTTRLDAVDAKSYALVRQGASLIDVAAGTLAESDYYGDLRVPEVDDYADFADAVWGFGNDAMNTSSDAPGMQGPNAQGRSLNAPVPVYPVSRGDMTYAYIFLGGAETVTAGTVNGRDEDTSSVYYLYTTGVDLSGIVARNTDGQDVDPDLYELVFSEAEEMGPPESSSTDTSEAEIVDDIDSAGNYDVYAQGKDDYEDSQTASTTFKVVKHEASVTSCSSGTATHVAAQACYATATKLKDPAFVVMAPAANWQASLVATALAGSGAGLAVFSDGTDTDDTMFQAIMRANVDQLSFVGPTSQISQAAIDRAKILVTGDEGAYNYFSEADAEALALDVYDKVAEFGPTSDNPHQWGDAAILMSPTSCLYTSSVAQYAYAAAAPVLFTKSDGSLSTETKEALSNFDSVVVAGDEKSVPASTISTLQSAGAAVTRICDESQAFSSSVQAADLMASELSATPSTVCVADATSPSCVMAASQLSALSGGLAYACASSVETKACQDEVSALGVDDIDDIYTVGPFTTDPSVAARMKSLWDDEPMDTGFTTGDTFEAGGLVFKTAASAKATLSAVADTSLTTVNAATAAYGDTTYTVDALSASALAGNKQITSVTLGNVSSIPANACKGCTALKAASFPAAAKMEASSFAGCTSLASVSVPKVTSIPASSFKGLKKLSGVSAGSAASIGASAFQNCSALKSAGFGSAKTIGAAAFSGCTSLTSVKLAKVTSIPASAFSGDKKLKSASFGTVTSIGASAFANCSALTSAPVAKATSIGASAFSGCTSIKSLKASSVKTIGANAFKGAKKMTKVNLASKKLTSIGANAFKGAKKMTKVNLASKKLTSIGANAFSGCKKLKKVTIKSTKLKKVGKKAFKGCAKKTTVKVPKAKVKKYKKLLSKAGISKKAKVKA